ncbi:site-specific DNA-methyltransferase [Candidatus Bathyarchaeota archaeon]|nr:site-specific DNA-methyltransferase [Candidatus Bathyarchaeota archaeon]
MSNESGKISIEVLQDDCLTYLRKGTGERVHLSFLDPPFNQGKDYNYFDDEQNPKVYWGWLKKILRHIFKFTINGGAIYFMQREKNTDWMMQVLKETGWTFQNLIVWKKLTSAVPCSFRYGKQHQVIIFATKGEKPRVFNKLRIDYPIQPWHKYERTNGIFVTDVWDDIRELTSGYFAGDEALRDEKGKRLHEQQSPVALLLRIILSSSMPGDIVFDPFAGTGTTLVVAYQLRRNAIGIEVDPSYVDVANKRLKSIRAADDISKYRNYYRFTSNLDEIWPVEGLGKYF